MTKQETDIIMQDIIFSHDSYSPIIFDSMYEMISKSFGEEINNKNLLAKHHLSKEYLNELKSYANKGRHTMQVNQFINKHNELIPPFNRFLQSKNINYKMNEYVIDVYEYAPKELKLNKVINQFHIIKLYEQFSIMQVHQHPRAILRLQMFFESSIRYHSKENEKEFVYMINTPTIMKQFVDYISDGSYSLAQQNTFVLKMMDLNKVRNKIKKHSNYDSDVDVKGLQGYAMLIAQKLEQEISLYDKPTFTSTQALLEYKNAFRELSFDYRYQVYQRLGKGVFTSEIEAIYHSDLAYQVYIINTIMEGLAMKRINDFEKIFQTIDQFEEMVNQLTKISEQYSDVKETFDEVTNNIKDFGQLNKQMKILSQVDFGKLSQFVNVQDEFTDGIKLSQVLSKFKERTEDIKDINQQIKELKKSIGLLDKQVKAQLTDG